MSDTPPPDSKSHWFELAKRARDQARRANARAATTAFPHVAARFENEAAFNLALARKWSEFAECERALGESNGHPGTSPGDPASHPTA